MSANKLLAAAAGLLVAIASASAATADTSVDNGNFRYTATVGGQDISGASESHPLQLDPKQSTKVEVRLINPTAQPVTVESIGLDGRILGLTLFNIRTAVSITVAPRSTEPVSFMMDVRDLDGQATGLVGGDFTVRTASGQELQKSIVSKVRGSLFSVYGLFGLGLLILTSIAAIDVALLISRRRLPENRFRRGLLTMTPGIGVGLVLIFSMSALAVWVPTGPRWILSALMFAGACFALGYFTGAPEHDDEDGVPEIDVHATVVRDGEPVAVSVRT